MVNTFPIHAPMSANSFVTNHEYLVERQFVTADSHDSEPHSMAVFQFQPTHSIYPELEGETAQFNTSLPWVVDPQLHWERAAAPPRGRPPQRFGERAPHQSRSTSLSNYSTSPTSGGQAQGRQQIDDDDDGGAYDDDGHHGYEGGAYQNPKKRAHHAASAQAHGAGTAYSVQGGQTFAEGLEGGNRADAVTWENIEGGNFGFVWARHMVKAPWNSITMRHDAFRACVWMPTQKSRDGQYAGVAVGVPHDVLVIEADRARPTPLTLSMVPDGHRVPDDNEEAINVAVQGYTTRYGQNKARGDARNRIFEDTAHLFREANRRATLMIRVNGGFFINDNVYVAPGEFEDAYYELTCLLDKDYVQMVIKYLPLTKRLYSAGILHLMCLIRAEQEMKMHGGKTKPVIEETRRDASEISKKIAKLKRATAVFVARQKERHDVLIGVARRPSLDRRALEYHGKTWDELVDIMTENINIWFGNRNAD